MKKRLGSVVAVGVGLNACAADAAPVDLLGPVGQNIWTRFAFGPFQIVWFVVAIILGAITFFLYYRGLLRSELRREPEPLEPAKHRLSAFAMAIITTALVLGWAGVGYVWLIGLLLLAAVIDFAGGRRWLLWIAIIMALGVTALGVFGS